MAYTDDALEEGTIALDGTEPTDSGELPPVERALGFILDEPDEAKVAEYVVGLREEQSEARSRNRAVWQRNVWWREGKRGVRLNKVQDSAMWEASIPRGMSAAPPVPNKTDRLCRRLTNTILVDKPYPDCEPGGDDNEDRDAAEFSTRYLAVKGSPAELNMARILRSGSDKANTYASAFGWVTMDPTKGGHRPRTMLAHPMARSKEDALIDPASGLQADETMLTDRYVRPDGFLSDDARDADLQWLPSPKVRLLTGLQLDFLPATARGMEDAIGVVITDPTTLGDLNLLFPKTMRALSQDQLQALCKWRPAHVKDVLPPFTTEPADQKNEDGSYKDAQMVIVTTVYYESCAEYPWGCYAVIGGDCKVLHKQKWSAMMQGRTGKVEEECLEIPVGQCRCLDDDINDNPMGIAIAEKIGPADEIRHGTLGFEMQHMFRAANPIPFLPIGSIVQPKQFQLRSGEPVFTNPQGKPEWENVPALDATIPALRVEMTDEMNDEAGLQQAAQGVEAPSVKSGTHAQTIIQEALKAVTNMKDNIGDFYIALNRIILQLSRAFCPVPQMLEYVGEDGAYKAKEWSRTDFRTTKRVSIAKGSFTMHTLLAKQEMANNAFDRQIIDADDYKELVAGGVNPVLGVQDNPHLMRVRMQLEAWKEGPPEGWVEAMQQFALDTQLYTQTVALAQSTPPLVDPMGQPIPPTLPEAPVPPPQPFTTRLPIDLETMPAKIRHRQLSRTMASTKFETFPPEWQQALIAEYMEMKNDAGIMTVPEVQAAQAQEQQMAAQAAQAQTQATAATEQSKAQLEEKKLALEARKIDAAAAPKQPAQPAASGRAIEHERDGRGNLVASTVRPMTATRINHLRDGAGRVVASEVSPMPS